MEMPGYLQPILQQNKWMDLLMKSDLSSDHKIVGLAISRTSSYNRQKKLSLCSISPYSISRIIKTNSKEVEPYLDDLIENGWLWDTGTRLGAKRVYAMTFNLLPRKIRQ